MLAVAAGVFSTLAAYYVARLRRQAAGDRTRAFAASASPPLVDGAAVDDGPFLCMLGETGARPLYTEWSDADLALQDSSSLQSTLRHARHTLAHVRGLQAQDAALAARIIAAGVPTPVKLAAFDLGLARCEVDGTAAVTRFECMRAVEGGLVIYYDPILSAPRAAYDAWIADAADTLQRLVSPDVIVDGGGGVRHVLC